MSEPIDHEKDGGALPGGSPPRDQTGDLARVSEALDREQEDHPDREYGHLETDILDGRTGPVRADQGKSTGRTSGSTVADSPDEATG